MLSIRATGDKEMAVRIERQKYKNSIVLIIRGRVGPEDTLTISKKIISSAWKRFRYAVVDLSAIEYLNSHWIGVFVHTWKVLHDKNKHFVFLIPKGFIRNQFMSASLGQIFTIIESLEELDALDYEDNSKERR